MKRRNFLKMLAVAPVAIKAAPLLETLAPARTITFYQYDLLLDDSVIDPIVAKCAEELAWRAGLTFDAVVAGTFA